MASLAGLIFFSLWFTQGGLSRHGFYGVQNDRV